MLQELPKTCTRCKQLKPTAEFYACPKNRSGLHSWCRSCCRADTRKWVTDNPTHQRAYDFKRSYGITIEQYEELLEEQDGVCAICSTPTHNGVGKRFHVDHCHKTNVVRGLLCGRCNVMLGMAQDDANRLIAAARYLDKFK